MRFTKLSLGNVRTKWELGEEIYNPSQKQTRKDSGEEFTKTNTRFRQRDVIIGTFFTFEY